MRAGRETLFRVANEYPDCGRSALRRASAAALHQRNRNATAGGLDRCALFCSFMRQGCEVALRLALAAPTKDQLDTGLRTIAAMLNAREEDFASTNESGAVETGERTPQTRDPGVSAGIQFDGRERPQTTSQLGSPNQLEVGRAVLAAVPGRIGHAIGVVRNAAAAVGGGDAVVSIAKARGVDRAGIRRRSGQSNRREDCD